MKALSTEYIENLKKTLPHQFAHDVENRLFHSELPYSLNSMVLGVPRVKVVDKNSTIVTFGSCFAQEVRAWLIDKGYSVSKDYWGVIYNIKQLEQLVRAILGGNPYPQEERYWVVHDKYFFPYLKSPDHLGALYLGNNERQADENLNKLVSYCRSQLSIANTIIITLGMTELWRNRKSKYAYFAIPGAGKDVSRRTKLNSDISEFYNLNIDEIRESLRYIIDTITEFNPKVNFILSTSPVPLQITYRNQTSAYLANAQSKSFNHAACLTICQSFENAFYMPSYEMCTSNPIAAYTEDARHIKRSYVSQIMKVFDELFVR